MALVWWKARFWRGGEQASTTEENGICRHVNTLTLKSIYERGGYCANDDEIGVDPFY